MFNKQVLDISKVWFRFSRFTSNGKELKFRWQKLPQNRFEEFVDFNMSHFVKHEITHVAAGIYKNPEAMKEYRDILVKQYRNPLYRNSICCVDDERSDIIAFDSLKLYRTSETKEDIVQPRTSEVKRLYHINHVASNLCPVPDVLAKYNVNEFLEDIGLAIHSDYRGCQMTKEVNILRRMVCKENAVKLTGAWMTSIAPQKTSEKVGWETVYEISYNELEKIIGIKFKNAPPMLKYKVLRIN